jgi:hypothetical protein
MARWQRKLVLWSLVAAAFCAAAPLRAQTFRLPGEDIGPITAPPMTALPMPAPPLADPMVAPPSVVPPGGDFVNVDQYINGIEDDNGPYTWQVLPSSLIYRSYLASTKESRMYGGVDVARDDSTFWNATTGARIGILRYGTNEYILPDGFQLDVEGSAQVRLDVPEDVDVRSVDFRGGTQLTYGMGAHRFKFGYYHLSSHLGDEFLLKNPGYDRLNFARDVLIFGYSYYVTPNLRLYGEAGWAFYTIVTEPWEFQFGIDYAPQYRTGPWGAPFWALNGHIREELDFSGNFTAQVGWAWRADNNAHLLRVGFQYFNGLSNQYSFAFQHEESFGFGIWYDF